MARLDLDQFDGIFPRQSSTFLDDRQAQVAKNVKLYAGELRYWRGPTSVNDPGISGLESIYRLYDGSGNSVWLGWDADVDVAESPVADNGDRRIYYTGDGTPKKTNYALASAGTPYPDSSLEMGVPAPTQPLTAVAENSVDEPTFYSSITEEVFVGDSISLVLNSDPAIVVTDSKPNTYGSSVTTEFPADETRVYVYTFISQFGTVTEESAPSPASNYVTLGLADVSLTGFESAPSGDYNITGYRVYRSVVGASTTSFQFVAEVPIADSTYVDRKPVAELGEVLPTTGWDVPPDDLAGITNHPSGFLVGFSGNTLYFSEPSHPHAWPSSYTLNFPFDIVGIGVVNQSVIVCTVDSPYAVAGQVPGAMSSVRLPQREPCVSKRSIAVDETALLYASPNGLVAVTQGSAQVATMSVYRRDEWQALAPEGLRAVIYDTKYVGFYNDTSKPGILFSRIDKPVLSTIDLYANGVFVDTRDAKLYIIDPDDEEIKEFDSSEIAAFSYTWRSKRWRFDRAQTFGFLRVDADYSQLTLDDQYNAEVAAIQAANTAAFAAGLTGSINEHEVNTFDVNGSELLNVPDLASSRRVQIFIYGDDGALVSTSTMQSLDAVRLPPFKMRELEIEIVGNIDVRSLTMTTTKRELEGRNV